MAVFSLVAALVLSACNDTGLEFSESGSSIITLSFQGLPVLDEGLHYHAWAVKMENGAFWGGPLGVFDVGEDGGFLDPVSGEPITGEFQVNLFPDEVFGVQVSIETSDTEVTQPSQALLLGGQLVGDEIPLSLEHWLGFGRSLGDLTGRFALLTPSDDDPDNELSGIWFVDYAGGSPSTGLSLPALPEEGEGWDYEGWIDTGENVLSTGRFLDPNLADSEDLHGALGGGLSYPGQDFLLNPPTGVEFPLDLSGATVFVTMEPRVELDPYPSAPFPLRVYQAQVPQEAQPGTTYALESLFNSLPTGTATVREDLQ